ncbi:MAG: C1 family peptidase [Burkholderiaceae bacterium]
MSRTIVNIGKRELKLDARADRLDLRDRPYTPRVVNLPREFPARDKVRSLLPDYLEPSAARILDQGQEGACTGFGLAAVINYLFWARDIGGKVNVSPRMAYHLAKFYDEWPGEDYSGSSCRGALKGWHKHGICQRALWPYTVHPRTGKVPEFEAPAPGWDTDAVTRPLGIYYRIDKGSVSDMQAALFEIGAIYVSADVHSGWTLSASNKRFTDYDSLPTIEFGSTSKMIGGHAFALVGYTASGFVVQNSWGTGWGLSGFAILSYADWVANGTDAWTVSLGVPIVPADAKRNAGLALRSPRAFSAGSGGLNAALVADASALPQAGKPYWQPLDDASARECMVVMGNNGMPINRLLACADAPQAVAEVTRHNALRFFARHPAAQPGLTKRVLLYAHGGLNSEQDSCVRCRILAPYFEENGIYPLFITWKSGAAEIIKDLLQDRAKEVGVDLPFSAGMLDKLKEAARDAWDRAIELLAQNLGAKSIWSEMKQNAMLGAQPGNALSLVAQELAALAQALQGQGHRLELHVAGHSAGSIVLGHMLDLFSTGAAKQALASCSLYAPACTVAFANAHYIEAVQTAKILDRKNFHVDVLSDDRERADTVGPYRKSLLYLVSRALEDMHKMPILGLLKAFDPACNHDEHWNEPRLRDIRVDLQRWQEFWWGSAAPHGFYRSGKGVANATFDALDRRQIETGARKVTAAHGSFDNDVDVIKATLGRILGGAAKLAPASGQWNLDY